MSRDIIAQTLMDWTKKTRMPFQVTPFPPIVIPVSRRPLFKRLQSREGEKAVLAGSYKKVGMDECWQQTRDKMLGFHQTETKPDRGGACWRRRLSPPGEETTRRRSQRCPGPSGGNRAGLCSLKSLRLGTQTMLLN